MAHRRLRWRVSFASLALASLWAGCAVTFTYPELQLEVCDNGIDDDSDRLLDCADPECDGSCGEANELCFDGRDNDLDGDVDWRDPRCWSQAAEAEVDTCTSILGGEWLFPAELGRTWVLDGGAIRADVLADGRPVLFGTSEGAVELSTRAITTGSYREAEVDVELTYLPTGGTATIDLVDPRELASSGTSQTAYAARVVAEGRWELDATLSPMTFPNTTTIEVLAPTDAPLFLTLRVRPGAGSSAWDLLGPDGESLWGFESSSSVRDAPFALSVVVQGDVGLVAARVARPSWDPCGGDLPRPETDLTTSEFAGIFVVAAAEPDGSVCMLVTGFGPVHWRRHRRGAQSSEMLGVAAETAAGDIWSMYIDDAGGVHALAVTGAVIQRLDASACGQPLVRDTEPVTLTNPRGTGMTPLAFVRGVTGEEILFELRTEDGLEHATAVSVEGSRHSFALGEAIRAAHFNGTPTRVGDHWVAPRQDVNDSITMLTLGDPAWFTSVPASRVPGAWENSFPGTLIWMPGGGDEFEALWIRGVRVPDPPRLSYSLAWGIMASPIHVRRAMR